MGHTYTNLTYHCVFSTRQRRPWLNADVMPRLTQFVGGIIRQREGKLLAMNGRDDHVHLLAIFPAKRALSDLLRDIKAASSGWIHDTFPDLVAFAWQEGYGAFTVCQSIKKDVIRYIDRQEEHHKEMTFEKEFILLLERNGIEYDPRYVLD